jgi:UbiD family decarboxylase
MRGQILRQAQDEAYSMPAIDMDKFRLRRFVERLDAMGEVETHDEPVALADLAQIIEASPKAVLFNQAGPERVELVANVNGSRKRMAAALGVKEADAIPEYRRRLANPQPIVEVSGTEAPVQSVVIQGDAIDLTRLPFFMHHQYDGHVYISSAIDYTVDPVTKTTNVGCRRLSLRGKRECGTNVTAPSDLKRIYMGCAERGERLPISFAVGSHPLDFMAAGMRIPADEIKFVGTLRGEPVPLVKCLTNDLRVPADAEMILEGYFDERGYHEPEGPYGEYVGFYGPVHMDPIFHVTAITMRPDVLHQSLLHGSGKVIHRAESVNLATIRLEAHATHILETIGVNPVQVYVTPSSSEGQHIRVSIKQTRPGLARAVIAALIGGMPQMKHVFVVDEDIDVTQDGQIEWCMCSRFQADRDLMVFNGIPGMPMDPSLDGRRIGAKAGFDLTLPFGNRDRVTMKVAGAARVEGTPRFQTVRQALEGAGPLYFADLMAAVGTKDGRDVALQLDELRVEGALMRNLNGQYLLGAGQPGATAMTEPVIDPNMGLMK